MARTYEVYLGVTKYSASNRSEQDKLHMFKPACIDTSVSKKKQRSDVSDIFTSEDTENVTRIPDIVSYEIYQWRILQ